MPVCSITELFPASQTNSLLASSTLFKNTFTSVALAEPGGCCQFGNSYSNKLLTVNSKLNPGFNINPFTSTIVLCPNGVALNGV